MSREDELRAAGLFEWTQGTAGAAWSLTLDRIYEGPLADPETEAPIPDTHAVVWHLTLRSEASEAIRIWWLPEDRVLGGPLTGWGKQAIGRLKRHLIRVDARRSTRIAT